MIPDQYQSDHLFLLMGTNPLPNYVAAQLLLKPGGKLYLMHSEATRPTAERLFSYWLNEEKGQAPQYVPVMEADSADIQARLSGELNKVTDGRVGLNYTGGTKIMSVHAYQTLLMHQENTKKPVALSYLDARSNRILIELGNNAPFSSDPVLYELKPTLEQVVGLHAFRLVTQIERTPHLSELAELLVVAHQDSAVGKAWRTWCDEKLKLATRTKKADQWDDEKLLRNAQLALPTDRLLAAFVSSFRQALMIEGEFFSLAAISQRAGFEKIKHLCEWLDGKWLEYHVLQIMQTIKDTIPACKLHDCGMGIKPKVEQNHSEFDVDIGAMQGYRLYAISCTTDSEKGMCKLKLFEAYLRARNMGGDEAHVGLVCFNENPQKIQQQLGRSWDAVDKICVIGRGDIPYLTNRLADWFKFAG